MDVATIPEYASGTLNTFMVMATREERRKRVEAAIESLDKLLTAINKRASQADRSQNDDAGWFMHDHAILKELPVPARQHFNYVVKNRPILLPPRVLGDVRESLECQWVMEEKRRDRFCRIEERLMLVVEVDETHTAEATNHQRDRMEGKLDILQWIGRMVHVVRVLVVRQDAELGALCEAQEHDCRVGVARRQ